MGNNQLSIFEQKNLTVFEDLSKLKKAIAELTKTEKELKAKLEEAMDEYGVVSFKNEYVTISRIEGSTTTTIDLDKLKQEEPELYEELLQDYPKVKTTKPSVRILAK